MISNKHLDQIIDIFSGSFSWDRKDVERMLKDFVEGFDDSKEFQLTRLELIKICALKKNPLTRWGKARHFLLTRLETQIPLASPFKHTNSLVLEGILDPRSYIRQCLNCVSLFNSMQIGFPEGVIIRMVNFDNFFDWGFGYPHSVGELEVKLKDGSTKKAKVPKEEFDSAHFKHQINNVAKKAIKKSYRHPSLNKPSQLLKQWIRILQDKSSLNNLRRRTGIELEKEPFYFLHSSLLDKYFPDSKNIVTCTFSNYPRYRPENPLLSAEALSLDLADFFLRQLNPIEMEEIFIGGIENIGYKIIKLNSFQELLEEWEKKKSFEKIEHAFETLLRAYSASARKKAITERKQYRFFVMVSELLKKGYSKREASNKVAKALNESLEYVRRQYYSKERELKYSGLSLQHIKDRYGWSKCNFEDLKSEHYLEELAWSPPEEDKIMRIFELEVLWNKGDNLEYISNELSKVLRRKIKIEKLDKAVRDNFDDFIKEAKQMYGIDWDLAFELHRAPVV